MSVATFGYNFNWEWYRSANIAVFIRVARLVSVIIDRDAPDSNPKPD